MGVPQQKKCNQNVNIVLKALKELADILVEISQQYNFEVDQENRWDTHFNATDCSNDEDNVAKENVAQTSYRNPTIKT